MKVSDAGIELIVSFESVRLTAYQDPVGIWTIGAGHTGPDVHKGLTISQQRAMELLRQDLAGAEAEVRRLVKKPLNQSQWDALVSLVFNAGSAPLTGTLGRLLNAGDYKGAAGQFGLWVNGRVNGKLVRLAGLVRRRAAETRMFTASSTTPTPLPMQWLREQEKKWVTRYDALVRQGKGDSQEARRLREKMRLQRKRIWRLAQPAGKGGDGKGWHFRHRAERYRALTARTT
jgi:lysozyme